MKCNRSILPAVLLIVGLTTCASTASATGQRLVLQNGCLSVNQFQAPAVYAPQVFAAPIQSYSYAQQVFAAPVQSYSYAQQVFAAPVQSYSAAFAVPSQVFRTADVVRFRSRGFRNRTVFRSRSAAFVPSRTVFRSRSAAFVPFSSGISIRAPFFRFQSFR